MPRLLVLPLFLVWDSCLNHSWSWECVTQGHIGFENILKQKSLVDIWGRLAPLSWMILFKNLITNVISNKCVIPSYSHPSWHGKVCFKIWKTSLWMIFMSLGVPMIFILMSGGYWFPNYVFITRGIVALDGATTTLGINSTNGNGSANGNGVTESGGTTRGGGARASTNT